MTMRRRPLGRTGLEVSEIGLGGIKLGQLDEGEPARVIGRALDLGANIIDTARVYRRSEELIGATLGARRKEVILSSKAQAITREEMTRDIETSLRNLRTDHIELYGLHSVAHPRYDRYPKLMKQGGAIEALLAAKEQGKIGHVYFSIHRNQVIAEEAIKTGLFEAVMLAYNLLNDELMDEKVMPLARERGMGVMIMKPLGGGFLAEPPEIVLRLFSGDGARVTPVQLALGFILENPNVSCAVPGMMSTSEAEEDCAVGRGEAGWGAEEIERFHAAVAGLGKDLCQGCGYCLPCTEEIPIPVILRQLTYATAYGMKEWAQRRYRMVEVPASKCSDCGECEERCPNGVAVRERLREAAALLPMTR